MTDQCGCTVDITFDQPPKDLAHINVVALQRRCPLHQAAGKLLNALEAVAQKRHVLASELASEYGHSRHESDRFEDCEEAGCIETREAIKEARGESC